MRPEDDCEVMSRGGCAFSPRTADLLIRLIPLADRDGLSDRLNASGERPHTAPSLMVLEPRTRRYRIGHLNASRVSQESTGASIGKLIAGFDTRRSGPEGSRESD